MPQVFVGNEKGRHIVKTIIQQRFSGQHTVWFLLLSWPSHIGKTTFLLSLIQQLLWPYSESDFLFLRDCHDVLGKTHELKIELPATKEKQKIECGPGDLYQDIGAREIISWLGKSALGGKKIVLIENIERANNAFANALLKNLEEPDPSTLLIATSSSQQSVLQTLLSRALLVWRNLPSESEIASLVTGHPQRDLLLAISQRKPWRICHLLQHGAVLLQQFVWYHDQRQQARRLSERFVLIKTIAKTWHLSYFLDLLTDEAVQTRRLHMIAFLIDFHKKMQANVHQESLLLSLAMRFSQ